MQFPSKIPTLLGILMVVVLVGGLIAVSESYFRTTSLASGSIAPENVQITNVTDTTFSVSWTTELAATGALSIQGPHIPKSVIFDEQDVEKQGKHVTHMVTYRAASPDSDYTVTILSNGKQGLDGDKPYTIHTPSLLSAPSGLEQPAYGTIVTATNGPVAGALVYVTLDGSQTLSAITKPSGTWLIPLNLVRTQDLSGYLPVKDRTTVNIMVRANGQETTAITDTLNDSPVPAMTIGRTYDFRNLNAKAPGKQLAVNPTPAPPGVVLGSSTAKPANTVTLTIPAQGAALPTTLPLIQGTGIPGKIVSVILGITKPLAGATTVGPDGLWSYTPTHALATGQQSVTVSTQDINNKPVAITHLFTVLKSGTQVLGDATPSATLAPTVTLAPLTTPAATTSPTSTSTLSAQIPPDTGYELPTLLFTLAGIGLVAGGSVLTFSKHTV